MKTFHKILVFTAVKILLVGNIHAQTYKPTQIIYYKSKPNTPMLVRVYKDTDQAARDTVRNANDFEWSYNAANLMDDWNYPFWHDTRCDPAADLDGDGMINGKEALIHNPNTRAALKALLDAGHIEDPQCLLGPPVA